MTLALLAISILAVFSHPDDETTVGPLLAKYAAAGHEVNLVAITSGQKGMTPNTRLAGDELGAAREEELRCSAAALGIRPPILLRFQDQGISAPPVMEQVAAKLRETIARTKPDVILTWGPEGVTGHPDHRVTNSVAGQVFQQRGLLAHKPRKLYHLAFPEARFSSAPAGRRPPFRTVSEEYITTEIDVGGFLDPAARSIRCHKTQWDDARMKEMDAMNRVTLGGRTFLRLAMSEVPPPAGKREKDLFEGLQASPSTSIRVEQYPDLKGIMREGDILFGVCSRGGPDAVWSEAKCERALALLNQVRDPRVQKMVVVSAIADLKWVIARKPAGIAWAAYNSEGGMTPKPEFGNIRASVTEFARIAQAAGMKAIWGPTHVMLQADPNLIELTRNLDGMAFQHQKVLQYDGVPAFIELTKKRAAEARRFNPSIRTTVQVVVGRGSNQQLIDALKSVAGDVTEIKVFSMRDTAAIGSITRAVRGEAQ